MNISECRLASPIGRIIAAVSCAFALCAAASAQTVTKILLTPSSVVGGTSVKGTVTVSPKAGPDGVIVTLTSSDAIGAVPQTVTIAKGKSTATFTVMTKPVASLTTIKISGTPSNTQAKATLTVKPPTLKTLILNPTSVAAGSGYKGKVTISSPAPANGLPVQLFSDKPNIGVPEFALVPGGSTSVIFDGTTMSGASRITGRVTATLNGTSIGMPLTVLPLAVKTLSFSSASVVGGNSVTGTVTMSGAAPANGLLVILMVDSSNPIVPTNIQVQPGALSATFSVSTRSVVVRTPVTFTAKYGSSAAKAKLSILPGAANNKFAGAYSGVFYSVPNDLGTLTISISAAGFITGSGSDDLTPGNTTIAGTVNGDGLTTITTTLNGKSTSHQGTLAFDDFGYLTGTFISSDDVQTTITLAPGGKILPFAGHYAGVYTTTSGDSGNVNIVITANGGLTGSGVSSQGGMQISLQGTVSTLGVVSVTVSNNGNQDKNTGGAAFNSSGKVMVIVKNSAGDVFTTVSLTRS